jgi:hypothetical protein
MLKSFYGSAVWAFYVYMVGVPRLVIVVLVEVFKAIVLFIKIESVNSYSLVGLLGLWFLGVVF